jgi:hypothetical protein
MTPSYLTFMILMAELAHASQQVETLESDSCIQFRFDGFNHWCGVVADTKGVVTLPTPVYFYCSALSEVAVAQRCSSYLSLVTASTWKESCDCRQVSHGSVGASVPASSMSVM